MPDKGVRFLIIKEKDYSKISEEAYKLINLWDKEVKKIEERKVEVEKYEVENVQEIASKEDVENDETLKQDEKIEINYEKLQRAML